MRKPGDGFSIIYTSPPEYERLCQEIYFDEYFFAEIIQEEGKEKAIIKIDPPPNGQKNWEFSSKELIQYLKHVENGLD